MSEVNTFKSPAHNDMHSVYWAYLEHWDCVRKQLHASQVAGCQDDIREAEFDLEVAQNAIYRFQCDLADDLLLAMQFALQHRFEALSERIGEIHCLVELADAVAALEARR